MFTLADSTLLAMTGANIIVTLLGLYRIRRTRAALRRRVVPGQPEAIEGLTLSDFFDKLIRRLRSGAERIEIRVPGYTGANTKEPFTLHFVVTLEQGHGHD